MIHRYSWNPCLTCDRCGLAWYEGETATQLRDNAKARGWAERRRYSAVREYCPGCAGEIARREEARKKRPR
jgi:hypothetical protein